MDENLGMGDHLMDPRAFTLKIMGEIADSMINGEFDCVTGEYIGEPCGYPRTIEGFSPKQNRNEANHKASIGIRVYLKRAGIPSNEYTKVVREYFVTVLGKSKRKTLNEMCAVINDDHFSKFDGWFKNKFINKQS